MANWTNKQKNSYMCFIIYQYHKIKFVGGKLKIILDIILRNWNPKISISNSINTPNRKSISMKSATETVSLS